MSAIVSSKNVCGKPFHGLDIRTGKRKRIMICVCVCGGVGQLLLTHSCHISFTDYNFLMNGREKTEKIMDSKS